MILGIALFVIAVVIAVILIVKKIQQRNYEEPKVSLEETGDPGVPRIGGDVGEINPDVDDEDENLIDNATPIHGKSKL